MFKQATHHLLHVKSRAAQDQEGTDLNLKSGKKCQIEETNYSAHGESLPGENYASVSYLWVRVNP